MELDELLAAVRSDRIEFVTMRPPGATTVTLERRVVLTGPPEVTDLATIGDIRILDALVDLLGDPARTWAAEVVLAAVTQREEKLVDTFAGQPEAWWDAVGRGAHERWRAWLDQHRDRLVWDADEGVFVERVDP